MIKKRYCISCGVVTRHMASQCLNCKGALCVARSVIDGIQSAFARRFHRKGGGQKAHGFNKGSRK